MGPLLVTASARRASPLLPLRQIRLSFGGFRSSTSPLIHIGCLFRHSLLLVAPIQAPELVFAPQLPVAKAYTQGAAVAVRCSPCGLPRCGAGGRAPGLPPCPLFAQASCRAARPEAAFQLHKPLVLFGVMISPFSRLRFSLGRLIPQRGWWKRRY